MTLLVEAGLLQVQRRLLRQVVGLPKVQKFPNRFLKNAGCYFVTGMSHSVCLVNAQKNRS